MSDLSEILRTVVMCLCVHGTYGHQVVVQLGLPEGQWVSPRPVTDPPALPVPSLPTQLRAHPIYTVGVRDNTQYV